MTAAQRTWSTLGAIVIVGGMLAGCTPSSAETDSGDGGNAASNSLNCNWDSPAVTVETAADPGVQEGVLVELMVGEWQRIGYDIGAGFQLYGAGEEGNQRDYRFVFSAEGEYVNCQTTPKKEREEARGDFTVEETTITLGDDGTFTALSWNADTMTWRNNVSGATVYLQRR